MADEVPQRWSRHVTASEKVRAARHAAGQFGRISRAQLIALGVQNGTVTSWTRHGFLFPKLPRVYAVGQPGTSEEADLFAAVLYAGPGAALCGLSAAVWRGLVKWRQPSVIEVRLIVVCEVTGIPLPETNEHIEGIEVDAVWWHQMVVVQCDGEGNHNTWRQRRRDAANDLKLRGLRFHVIRYTLDLLDDPWAIHADLMPQLEERRGW